MKLNKPKFWSKKNSFIAILLLPFSWIFLLLIFFKKKLIRPLKFNIPIICVGNIYIGGTGKTPTTILLANELLNLGKNPVIIRKYYSDHLDEHSLIRAKYKNLLIFFIVPVKVF